MKTLIGLVITCAALAGLLAHLGCGTTNPCIGPASARPTMPCTCPGTTDPACYPFPSDARKPDGGTDR